MRSRERIAGVLAVLGLASSLALGCGHGRAPRGFLSSAGDAIERSSGTWISVETRYDGWIRGELLAADYDSVWVLVPSEEREPNIGPGYVQPIPWGSIVDGHFQSSHGSASNGLWAVAGAASTLSHGYYLVITAPVWLIVGLATNANESVEGQHEVRASYLHALQAASRFPGGLPAGLDRNSLVMNGAEAWGGWRR